MDALLNKIWRRLGRAFFLVTWPGIWLVVRLSPPRTRVLVIHDGEALLVKDWLGNGKWKLPGGGMHRDENPIQGAIRELKEEVSILATSSQLRQIAKFKTRSNRMNAQIIAFVLQVSDRPDVKMQPYEISDYTWCSLDDIDLNKVSLTTRTVLEHFKKS